MIQKTLLIGVDGGGSKTLALIANSDGQILGRGSASSSNHFVVGFEAAKRAIWAAICEAMLPIEGQQNKIAAICLGLAGMDRPGERALFAAWLEEQFPGAQATLANDAELVLAAGTPAGWGIAIICGTGSIVIGRDPTGNRVRADGWGYLLGDFGGGYAIGLAALRAVMEAYDGRGLPTSLSHYILQHCHVENPPQLLAWVYRDRVPTAEIAALAQWVEIAAEEGDKVAEKILQESVGELVRSIRAVAKQLKFSAEIPCALAGGVLTHSTTMVEQLQQQLIQSSLSRHPLTVVLEPAVGAIRLAIRSLRS